MLTLLTATGCRPEAWRLCERMMDAQDFDGPVHWIVVDDGQVRQPVTFCRDGWSLEIVRPPHRWKPGLNTQAANLAAGLDCIAADARVVVIEDDDAYSPGYLSDVSAWLDRADLVGEGWARYYHVGRRVWRDCGNDKHASLCSTAVKGPALIALREAVERNDKFIDISLWRGFGGSKALHRTRHVIGIKGLPGRGGIGAGHRMQGRRDPHGHLLRQWLGEMAESYLG